MASNSNQPKAAILEKLTVNPQPKCQSCEDVSLSSIAYCFVCDLLYCENCWNHHQRIQPNRDHNSITLDDAKNMSKEELKQAQDSVSNKKELANVVTPQEAMANSKFITAAYEGFTNNVDKLQQVMTKGEEMEEKVKQRRKKVDEEIKSAFTCFHQELDKRERALLADSSHSAVGKRTRLSFQRKELSQLKKAMEDCHKLARAAESQDDWSEVHAEAERLLAKFSENSLELCENADIAVEVKMDHVLAVIESFGYVATGASPSKSTVTGLPLKVAVGREVTVRVHTRNACGEEIDHGGEVVQGMLNRKGKVRSQVIATTHDKGDGTYLLSINPKEEGEHFLSVTLHGQHVQKSPFMLPPIIGISEYYASMKNPVKTITGINKPHYIAFHGNGDMLVTSYGDDCVYVYDSSGSRKATIGKRGTGDLEFNSPYGIAITGDTVYVGDYSNHRVQCFTTSGKFLSKFGFKGSSAGQFSNPIGISVSSDNLIYVGDSGNHRVQVFRSDNTLCHSISGNVSGKAAFNNPYGVTIAPDGNLFVAGYGSNNVTVFTPEGRFVRSFEVKQPAGVTVDAAGFSFVITYANLGSLSIFDPNGRLVHTVGGFNLPQDTEISSDGSVWISEYGGSKLLRYIY